MFKKPITFQQSSQNLVQIDAVFEKLWILKLDTCFQLLNFV
jgi:hypothetical protein